MSTRIRVKKVLPSSVEGYSNPTERIESGWITTKLTEPSTKKIIEIDNLSAIGRVNVFKEGGYNTEDYQLTSDDPFSTNQDQSWISEVYIGTSVSSINEYAFKASRVEKIFGGENIQTIKGSAFSNCANISSLSFPSLEKICGNAFDSCESLEFVDCPELTATLLGNGTLDIGSNQTLTFNGCSKLSSVNFPKLQKISSGSFRNTGLLSVDFPLVDTIGTYAFTNCKNLSSVNLPSLIRLGEYNSGTATQTFQICNNLSVAHMPKCEYVYSNIFGGTKINDLELGNLSKTGFANIFGGQPWARDRVPEIGNWYQGEEPVKIKLFCNYTEEQRTCQLSDDAYATISADPIPNLADGAYLSAVFKYQETQDNYQVWVPASKYWTFIAHEIWGSEALSSHIKWYGDQNVIPMKSLTEEIELDPTKTYFITNTQAKSISINVNSLDSEQPTTMTVYDIVDNS